MGTRNPAEEGIQAAREDARRAREAVEESITAARNHLLLRLESDDPPDAAEIRAFAEKIARLERKRTGPR